MSSTSRNVDLIGKMKGIRLLSCHWLTVRAAGVLARLRCLLRPRRRRLPRRKVLHRICNEMLRPHGRVGARQEIPQVPGLRLVVRGVRLETERAALGARVFRPNTIDNDVRRVGAHDLTLIDSGRHVRRLPQRPSVMPQRSHSPRKHLGSPFAKNLLRLRRDRQLADTLAEVPKLRDCHYEAPPVSMPDTRTSTPMRRPD